MITEIQLFEDFRNVFGEEQIALLGEEFYVNDLVETTNRWIAQLQANEPLNSEDLFELLYAAREYYRFLVDKELLDNVQELLTKKTQDYNSDKAKDPNFRLDDARLNYFPFGHYSYVHMILTKVQRIESLFKANTASNFEGKNDSLIDVAAYLSFYYSFLLEEEDRYVD